MHYFPQLRWTYVAVDEAMSKRIMDGIVGANLMLCLFLQAILEMEGVDTSEFSEEVLACLPPTPWQISPGEIFKRKDLRSLRYMSFKIRM